MRLQVLTKSVTAAVLNAVGDVLAQKWIDGSAQLDWKRLGKFTFLVRAFRRGWLNWGAG